MNKFENGVVYHYTSPEGIFSILRNKTLWFTDAEYLNDQSENVVPKDKIRRYVLSASLSSDSIALWNYYVKNDSYQGYSLGMKFELLVSALEEDIKAESLPIKVEHGEVSYKINTPNPPENKLLGKLRSFSSEREYRFILCVPERGVPWKKDGKFVHKFRVGNSGIITPYIEWKFTMPVKERLFTRITLAPMIEEKLAVASFERFLDTQVQQRIDVVPSSIKVRF